MRTTKSLVLAGLLALLVVPVAGAQRSHLGFRAGYNFDRDDAVVGGQVFIPIASMIELYPSVDYYLTDAGTVMGFNVDLKWRNQTPRSALYFGGGLNMLRASAGGASNVNTGGNLFAGLESRLGATHPFFEVRGLLHEQSSVQLVAGLNFTLR
jgi:hypothetical protein